MPSFPVTEGGLKEGCTLVLSLLSKLGELQPSITQHSYRERKQVAETSGVPGSYGRFATSGGPHLHSAEQAPSPWLLNQPGWKEPGRAVRFWRYLI